MYIAVFNNKYDRLAFRRVMNYIAAAGSEEKTSFMGSFNVLCSELAGQILEMEALAQENLLCRNPLHHGVISWAEGEIPSYSQCEEAAGIYLDVMKMPDCACVWGLHRNTENYHMHLCVNKIDPLTCLTRTPADGWTKKACEHIARLIESRQGWQRFHGKFWDFDDCGNVIENTHRPNTLRTTTGPAKEMENNYGVKSALTIAKDEAAGFLYSDASWQELHDHLAACNMKLEPRKKGLVLHVGDKQVKLSSIGGGLSQKKLAARLGPWEPPLVDFQPAPIKQVSLDSRFESLDEYHRQREARRAERGEKLKGMSARHKHEAALLKEQHKEQLSAFTSIPLSKRPADFKGKKAELRRKQKEELRLLRERQKKELSLVRKSTKSFPRYEDWLKQNNRHDQRVSWTYRSSADGILSGSPFVVPRPIPLPGLEGHSFRENKGWSVDYAGPDGRARFCDHGSRIVVYDWKDKGILARALRIAAQRWGSLTVSGSPVFADLAAELASSMDIQLEDKALAGKAQLIAKSVSAAERSARETGDETIEDFERLHAAVSADRYLIWVHVPSHHGDAGKRTYTLGGRGLTPSEVISQLPSLKEDERRKNAQVRITPVSDSTFHILMKLSIDELSRLKKAGVRECVRIEAEPGAVYVVMNVKKCCGIWADEARIRTQQELRSMCGSSSDEHLTSLPAPGFRCGAEEAITSITYMDNVQCEVCGKLLGKALKQCETEHLKSASDTAGFGHSSAAQNVSEAYMLHARQILAGEGCSPNYSAVDGRIAVRLAVTGYSHEEIMSAVRTGSPLIRPRRMRDEYDWEDYAKRIADAAETPAGMTKRLMRRPKREAYLRIEGRWTQEDERCKVHDAKAGNVYTGTVLTAPQEGTFLLKTQDSRTVRVYVPEEDIKPGDKVQVTYGEDISYGGAAELLPAFREGTEEDIEDKEVNLENRPNVSVFRGTVTDVDNSARTFTTVSKPGKDGRRKTYLHYLTRLKGEAPRVGDIVDVEYTKGRPVFEVKFIERAIPRDPAPVKPSPGYKVTDAVVVEVNEDTYVTEEPRTSLRVEHRRNWKYINAGDKVSVSYGDDVTNPKFLKVIWAKPYRNLTVTDVDRENGTFVTVSEDGEVLTHSMADFKFKDRLEAGHRVSISFPDNNPRFYGSIFNISTWEEYKKRRAEQRAAASKAKSQESAASLPSSQAETPSQSQAQASDSHMENSPAPAVEHEMHEEESIISEAEDKSAVTDRTSTATEPVSEAGSIDEEVPHENRESGEPAAQKNRFEKLRVTGIDRELDSFTAVDEDGVFSTHSMTGFRWKSRLEPGHIVTVSYPDGDTSKRAQLFDHTAYDMYSTGTKKASQVQSNPYRKLTVTEVDRAGDTFTGVDASGVKSVHSMAGYKWKGALAIGHVVSVQYPENDITREGSIFNETTYEQRRSRAASADAGRPRNPYGRLKVTAVDRELDTFTAVDAQGNTSVHSMSGFKYKDRLEAGHEVSVKYPDNDTSREGEIFNKTTYSDFKRRTTPSEPVPYALDGEDDLREYTKEGVGRMTARPWMSYHGRVLKLNADQSAICFINPLGSRFTVLVSNASLAKALERDVSEIENGETLDVRIGAVPGEAAEAKSLTRESGLGL